MSNSEVSRLCGGTFFILLQQAVKQRQKARDRLGGGNDGLNAPNMLKSLIRVAQPGYLDPAKSTFAQNTSDYKACKTSGGTYLPFSDTAFVAAFDNRIKNEYATALVAMLDFVNSYIDAGSAKHVWLVKALIELIGLDTSISDSELFYVRHDGKPVAKSTLCVMADVQLPAFLLGVWHYIVTNRIDNTIGRATFECWHTAPESNGAQWTYHGRIGEGITRAIRVIVPECAALDTEASIIAEDEAFTNHGAACEEEPVSEPAASTTTQIINSPAVFFNSGANCTQINNTGVLNINRGEKA